MYAQNDFYILVSSDLDPWFLDFEFVLPITRDQTRPVSCFY